MGLQGKACTGTNKGWLESAAHLEQFYELLGSSSICMSYTRIEMRKISHGSLHHHAHRSNAIRFEMLASRGCITRLRP